LETGFLLAGDVDPARLYQLQRASTPWHDSPPHLAELRLQNMDGFDLAELRRLAEASGKPKLRRAAEEIVRLAEIEAEEYELL
jgi:hypothetical protein